MSISDYELRRVNRGAGDNARFSVVAGLICGGFALGLSMSGMLSQWWAVAFFCILAAGFTVIGGLGLRLHGQVHYQRGFIDGRKGAFKP